jgi:hypothetical protein
MKSFRIYLVKGRINFEINGKLEGSNNHPSCIIIFKQHERDNPQLRQFLHKENDLLKEECSLEEFI